MIQGNGKVVNKEFDIQNNTINSLIYSLPGLLEIKVDPSLKGKETLTIEGEENILQGINVDTGNTLEFKLQGSFNLTKPLKVVLHTSNMKHIVTSGTGEVTGQIVSSKLKLNSSGTGNVHLTGNVDTLQLSLSETGNFNGKELYSNMVDLSISGMGNAQVYATDSADISVSGMSKVKVFGSPEEYTQQVSGMATIEKITGNKNKP